MDHNDRQIVRGEYHMLLNSLIRPLQYDVIQGTLDKEIRSIAYDSRNVTKDSVFVVITGFTKDGRQYIPQAIEKGATVLVVDHDVHLQDNREEVTILKVRNSREALAIISAEFYEHPGDALHLIGITGTNGKTSTTYLLKEIFEQAKHTLAVIGTNGTVMNDKRIENKTTTPESLELQQLLCEMHGLDISTCMMEVSSHALELYRVHGLHYDIGIFMNLTPDHLELHKTMEHYFQAKAALFELTNKFNIINVDDSYGKRLVERLVDKEAKIVTFGVHEEADIYPTDIEYSFNQTTFVVHTPAESAKITVNIPGEIYLYNSLAAIATAVCSGISLDVIQKGFEQLDYISGRMELAYDNPNLKVVIDFAHTEDALRNVLQTLRPYVKGRLILVFGVYADMSESGANKRLGMGKVAATYADYSIVTSDNPKWNNPEKILQETSAAVEKYNGNYVAILDRKAAIEYAIQMSQKDDMVLLAGKGHEMTQIIGAKAIPFNEKDIVLNAIHTNKLDGHYLCGDVNDHE